MNDQINPLALAITKALAYTENGGKPDVKNTKAGKSGELKSVWQFLPETWKRDSKEITGHDNVPATPENEAAVVYGKVSKWVMEKQKEGKDTDTIAKEIGSEWNSGNPNAYAENKVGTNNEGIKYNVPEYANKVANYTKKFISSPQASKNPGMISSSTPIHTQNPGMLNNEPDPQIGAPIQSGFLNA
jgi:hypothetical protein